MSFILDALRKSESQRRLESVPEVMRVPLAVKRERAPRWALGVIALLALALVAVTLVGLYDRPDAALRSDANRETTSTETTSTLPSSEPAPSTAPASSRGTTPSRETPLSTSPSQSTVSQPEPTQTVSVARPSPQLEARAAAEPPAVMSSSPAISTAPSEQVRTADPVSLPSIAALRAAGVTVPALDLQLLVTSSAPASRLIVVNGNRYREGERLLEGPEVVAITSEGAVLRHVGRDFLLVAD